MRVEREIAAFAFPFAAGVIAAVILGTSPCIISLTYPIIALMATILSSAALLHPARKDWDPTWQWTIVSFCALACGTFIGLSGVELALSDILEDGNIKRLAAGCGRRMKDLIDEIPFECSSTNGIIKALLTGDRTNVTPEITNAFRSSGASHILALSGLHLGIIYMIISKSLSVSGNSIRMRRVRSAMIIFACGLYTLATGAGASITRAFIFITLKEIAEMTRRCNSLKCILAASLILHLAIDPTVASDVGFQLSHAAMIGIAFIFPYLRQAWKNNSRSLRWIWESASLSISCQITTGPLAYIYFGTFPQYFLITNLIAIPLAGIIIPSALLTLIFSAMGWCPVILIRITEWVTQTMIGALDVISLM